MINKKIIAVAVSGVMFTLAQGAHATNGDQMLGVTATQWGMGGAIVAAPQDAASIMYNPAGIAELAIKDVRFVSIWASAYSTRRARLMVRTATLTIT